MTDLEPFRQTLNDDRHLGVLITTRPGIADPQVAVVNTAIIDHPITGHPVVAVVARSGAKLANLRRHPRATIVAKAGWEWAAVSGRVELFGPDDYPDGDPGLDPDTQRRLLRSIYLAAGGHHPNLDSYDDIMLAERRCAVLLHPEHCWTNPPGSEHLEPESTLT
jgi:hypothetical protein